jgi:hypothetical protein
MESTALHGMFLADTLFSNTPWYVLVFAHATIDGGGLAAVDEVLALVVTPLLVVALVAIGAACPDGCIPRALAASIESFAVALMSWTAETVKLA